MTFTGKREPRSPESHGPKKVGGIGSGHKRRRKHRKSKCGKGAGKVFRPGPGAAAERVHA